MKIRTDVTWWVVDNVAIQVSWGQGFYYGRFSPSALHGRLNGQTRILDDSKFGEELMILLILGEEDRAYDWVDYHSHLVEITPTFRKDFKQNHQSIRNEKDLPDSFFDELYLREWIAVGGWWGMSESERLLHCLKDHTVKEYLDDTVGYENRLHGLMRDMTSLSNGDTPSRRYQRVFPSK